MIVSVSSSPTRQSTEKSMLPMVGETSTSDCPSLPPSPSTRISIVLQRDSQSSETSEILQCEGLGIGNPASSTANTLISNNSARPSSSFHSGTLSSCPEEEEIAQGKVDRDQHQLEHSADMITGDGSLQACASTEIQPSQTMGSKMTKFLNRWRQKSQARHRQQQTPLESVVMHDVNITQAPAATERAVGESIGRVVDEQNQIEAEAIYAPSPLRASPKIPQSTLSALGRPTSPLKANNSSPRASLDSLYASSSLVTSTSRLSTAINTNFLTAQSCVTARPLMRGGRLRQSLPATSLSRLQSSSFNTSSLRSSGGPSVVALQWQNNARDNDVTGSISLQENRELEHGSSESCVVVGSDALSGEDLRATGQTSSSLDRRCDVTTTSTKFAFNSTVSSSSTAFIPEVSILPSSASQASMRPWMSTTFRHSPSRMTPRSRRSSCDSASGANGRLNMGSWTASPQNSSELINNLVSKDGKFNDNHCKAEWDEECNILYIFHLLHLLHR